MPATQKCDEELLAEYTRGRKSALGELARRHEPAFLGLAAGLLGGRNDLAMDAVQESWVRVVRFCHCFNGRSSFKTWAYRIVVNQCRDLARLNEAHDRAGETSAGTVANAIAQHHDDRRASNNRPDAAAETQEQSLKLRQTVDTLGPERREIVLLCYHEGLTHAEAAEVLDIPIGTLKSRLHAALKELREKLVPHE